MTNAKAQMIKTDVVAGFILALLMGTMWADTRPAPTTVNPKSQFLNLKQYQMIKIQRTRRF